MRHRHTLLVATAGLLMLLATRGAEPAAEREPVLSFGVIGMAGGAVQALAGYGDELGVRVTHLTAEQFRTDPLPDLSRFDALLTFFASGDLREQYRRAITAARTKKPALRVFCVGPPAVFQAWAGWVGEANLVNDARLAAYYGMSRESMRDLLRYALVAHFERPGEVPPPGAGKVVRIHHPDYGEPDDLDTFLAAAAAAGWDTTHCPRVALGSWRHHVLFHQPQVIDGLIRELAGRGILAVCLVADDAGFRERLKRFRPDLVIMTSHTQEPVEFWQELGVPRLHALWFTGESIDQWRSSDQTGMAKSAIFHQITAAELKGATECLTAGGTRSGGDSGEEILPIPDRIRRLGGRTAAWIALARQEPAARRLAIVVYDRDADKAGLLSGPAHNLNAPRSLLKLLAALQEAGYGLRGLPADEAELLQRLVEHGRQMGAWEPGALDRLATSGKAVLVPEEQYRAWFEESVPAWRRDQVVKQWGPPPGDIMVWAHDGKRFLVLPGVDLGSVRLLTQPLKGETITASLQKEDPDESLLPPTHHFLATYLWIQREFHASALLHFGSHGSEWLFPGKQAVLSAADWSDILLGDLPNVNPWLMTNTSELLPCKRRAQGVTIGFLPAPLMAAGLSDELLNLESTIGKYESLDAGALKQRFAAAITEQVKACGLDRELDLRPGADGMVGTADITRLSGYLHDLGNEQIPACMHVLGEPPPPAVLIPYLVSCMGKRPLDAFGELFPDLAGLPGGDPLQAKAGEVLEAMLHQGRSAPEAIAACGGRLPPGGALPTALREGLDAALQMAAGLQEAHGEIDRILAALNGRFIPPGPAGNPERNPAVIPSGRNLFVMNPQELPSRASWELGSKLIRDYLENQRQATGHYPRKIAFSLVPFATYSDFGIIESQILFLMGVRPIWDSRNAVCGVELIPAAELGRPRIDVFLSVRSIYRDELPSLVLLLDRAVRLAASQKEAGNYVYEDSMASRSELTAQGVPAPRAEVLAKARLFGAKPEEIIDSHNWFFYLSERSGEWDSREDLLKVYLDHSKHVYTEGAWGENAPAAFDQAIRGTELILRSWYDSRDAVLSNKFAWWVDGMLSLAIKQVTGSEPDYLFVDVRNPDQAGIVDAGAVVQKDFRARLTNPRWIAATMRDGYAGASAMATAVDNLMGWEITREASVSDAQWEELVDVYVRDRRNLHLREWLDASNPYAFQKLTVTLMETMRKGFWNASPQTRQEVVAAYADSVARHGRSGGPREGGNQKLDAFVGEVLGKARTAEADRLLERFRQRSAEQTATGGTPLDPVTVQGQRLERLDPAHETSPDDGCRTGLLAAGAALLVVLAGFLAGGSASRDTHERPL